MSPSFIGRPGRIIFSGILLAAVSVFSQNMPLLWTIEPSGADLFTRPASGPDGTIHFASIHFSEEAEVRLYQAGPDGTVSWISLLKPTPMVPFDGVFTSPVVARDGTVFVGAANQWSQDPGYFFAINPDGSIRWKVEVDGVPEQTPALAKDGTVYFIKGGNTFVALNPDGSPAWEYAVNNLITSPPVLGFDGTIYLGSSDWHPEGNILRALRPDGTLRWNLMTPEPAVLGALTGDGSLCFVTGGTVHMVNSEGVLRWSWESPSPNVGAPSIGADGTIYFGSDSGLVIALTQSGQLKWSYPVGESVSATPAIAADGTIFFNSQGGSIYALDSAGRLKDKWQNNDPSTSSPLLNGSELYFGSRQRILVFQNNAGPAEAPWPMLGGNPGGTGSSSFSLALETPSNLTVSLDEEGRTVLLNWEDAAQFAGYEVWRSSSGQFADAAPLDLSVFDSSFRDTMAMAGLSYSYWVRSKAGESLSSLAGPVMITLPARGEGEVLWRFSDSSLFPGAVALDGQGRFYAGSTAGKLHCFSPDGDKLWEFRPGKPILSAPAIGPDGVIYFGSAGFMGDLEFPILDGSGSFYALNPDGSIRWSFGETGVAMSPVIGEDGTIYFANANKRFYALDGEGRIHWEASPGNGGHIMSLSSPAIYQGGLLFHGSLSSFSRKGELIWSFNHGSANWSSPALGADGTVYVGRFSSSGPGGGFAAYGHDGAVRWSVPSGSVRSSPAIGHEGTVYFGSDDGSFYAVTKEGEIQWTFMAGAPVFSSPAIDAAENLYFGAQNGRLYCLNKMGEEVWELTLGQAVRSSPAIGPDGRVYIAADGEGVFVIQGTAPLADSPWPTFQGKADRRGLQEIEPSTPMAPSKVAASQGNLLGGILVTWDPVAWAVAYELRRGLSDNLSQSVVIQENLVHTVEFKDRTAAPGVTYYYWVKARGVSGDSPYSSEVTGFHETDLRVTSFAGGIFKAPAIAADGTVYLPINGAGPNPSRLAALTPDGDLLWGFEVPESGLTSPAVGADGTIYFGAQNGIFYALAPDGSKKWEFMIGERIEAPPAIGREMIFLGSLDKQLYALDLAGRLLWKKPLDCTEESAPILGRDGTICLLIARGARVTALSPNGFAKWTVFLGNDAGRGLAIGIDDTVYISTRQGKILAVRDGEIEWQVQVVGEVSGSPVVGPDGNLYVGTLLGMIYRIHPQGWILAEYRPFQQRIASSLALAADGSVLAGGRDSLMILNPEFTRHDDLFLDLGIMAPPTFGAEGRIYLGSTSGKFLILHSNLRLAQSSWPLDRGDARRQASVEEPPTLPKDITLRATGTWAGTVLLEWNDQPVFARYQIWRSTTPDFNEAKSIAEYLTGATSYRDATVQPGVNYHYWIQAENSTGTSPVSPPASGAAVSDISLRWQVELPERLNAPSIGLDGTIYVTDVGQTLYALRKGDGAVLWTYPSASSAPAVGPDGVLYWSEGSRLTALAPDGTVKWQVESGRDDFAVSFPAISKEGFIYWSSGNLIQALDSAGELAWEFEAETQIYTSPSITPSGLICFATGQNLYLLNPTGSIQWIYPTGTDISLSTAISRDGTIYFGSNDQHVHAIREDGGVHWKTEVGWAQGDFPSLEQDGSLIIPVNQAAVHRLDRNGNIILTLPLRASAPAATRDGTLLVEGAHVLNAFHPDGSLQWQFHLEIPPESSLGHFPQLKFPVLNHDGTLCVTAGKRLAVLDTLLAPAESGWPMFRANAQRTGQAEGEALIRIRSPRLDSAGNFIFEFALEAEAHFRIEVSEDLAIWRLLTSGQSSVVSNQFQTGLDPSAPKMFYRVVRERPGSELE